MLIILIAGASGAGKSTLSRALLAELNAERPESARLISMDNYYNDCPEGTSVSDFRQNTDFSQPASIDVPLLLTHLQALQDDQEILQPVYDFVTSTRSTTEAQLIKPADIVIVEGLLAFMLREPLENIPLLTVDVTSSSYLSLLNQRYARDRSERGRTEPNKREESKFLGYAYFFNCAKYRHDIDVSVDTLTDTVEESIVNIKHAITSQLSARNGL